MKTIPLHQRGVASLMVILLTGLSLTVAALGMMYMVQGTQERQLAVHAMTPAQLKAWSGVELVRQYLTNRTTQDLEALTAGELKVEGALGLTVQVLSKTRPDTERYRFVVNLAGSAADSTAIVQAVYDARPLDYVTTSPADTAAGTSSGSTGSSSGPTGMPDLVKINGDLNLGGSVSFEGAGEAAVSVNGKVNLSGNVTGLDSIKATGDITLESNASIGSLTSNGTVTLAGSASAITVASMKDVVLSGNANAGTVTANGSVSMAGRQIGTANAIGNVSVTGGTITTINTQGNVSWTSADAARTINANGSVAYGGSNNTTTIVSIGNVSLSGGTVQTVRTQGNTALTQGTIQGRLDGQGSLAANPGTVASGTIGGALPSPVPNGIRNVQQVAGYKVAIDPVKVTPVTQTVVQSGKVDAYTLRSAANYIFELDAQGRRQVTVQNVQGIANGVYLIGNYPSDATRGYRAFLCTAVDANGVCTEPVKPGRTICYGATTYNTCLNYSGGTWLLSGQGFAPGVLWFKGNLQAGNGTYYNSMIATGNITTIGSNKTVAVNYAGYRPICTNTPRTEDRLIASSDLNGLYPKNLCDVTQSVYVPSAAGNLAFLAGGYVGSTFSGGTITLGSSNDTYGSVMAGDRLVTSGNTRVYGTLGSASQGGGTQSMTGSTTIDTTGWPDTYTPEQAPGYSDASSSEGGDFTGEFDHGGRPEPTVTVVWTRYL
ncbi:hypothetical protein IQ22_03144 [Pseudomonas duriflava]|uniref:DUF342 domain-containing protein n=2 Tax=Pseudomonas duriflava TaxID=459528 RepID=A0A562Q7S7_9PSED|nr:hypothetical protein IQ22_03144 [Pseudomonas duriflava]